MVRNKSNVSDHITGLMRNPVCAKCIKDHMAKYQGFVDANGKSCKEFSVPCRGIPSTYISEKLKTFLTPAEQLEVIEMNDPSTWARNWIKLPDQSPWIPRWYQENMLRCTSPRVIVRAGRRIGKSDNIAIKIIHTMFYNANKRILVVCPYKSQAEEIVTRVRSFIHSNPKLVASVKRDVSSPFYELSFHNGSRLRAFSSGTKSGAEGASVRGQDADEIYIDEFDYLTDGDINAIIAIVNTHPHVKLWVSSTPTGRRSQFWRLCLKSPSYKEFYHPSSDLPHWKQVEEQIRADYAGQPDGWTHEICLAEDTLVQTTNGEKKIQDIIDTDYVYNHNNEPVHVLCGAKLTGEKEVISVSLPNYTSVCATPDHSFPDRSFQKTPLNMLNELPIYRIKQYDRRSEKVVLARLVGYNLGDGTINSTRMQSSFYSSVKGDMEQLRKDICYLWPEYSAQVICDIVHNTHKENALVKVDGPRCTLNVSTKITQCLLDHGAIRGKKVEQVFRVPEFVRNINKSTVCYGQTIIDSESFAIKAEFLGALFGVEGSTPRQDVGYMPCTIALSMDKRQEVDGSVFFDDLVELLTQLGIRSTWTAHPKGTNITYTLYVYSDYQNIKHFFDIVGYRYASEKEDLAFYWSNYISCWEWELYKKQCKYHKAMILKQQGHTYKQIQHDTGLTVSQIDKVTSRGLPKRLYGHEYDQFDMWLAKHLHQGALFIPFKEKPYQHKTLYKTYNITVDSYDHSYLLANGIRTFNCAEFGEEGVSLFQHSNIETALESYKYTDQRYDKFWIYSIGIDWNTDHGTEICVVGFDKSGNFKVVDAVNIGRQGWTQLAGINAIVDMNKKWQPAFIYADQGAGATAIEFLRMHGQNSLRQGAHTPDARLRTIVHAYDFGSKIEAHDPMTKQPIKKHAKPFLVENAIRFFEEGRIKISEYDTTLREQLGNYIVKHRTTSGVPVYGQTDEKIGDHRLDALMLALVGFKLEMSDFGRPFFDTHIAIAPGFGQSSQDKQANYNPENRNTPEARFEMPTSKMPGVTNSGRIAETRPGWETDEEDKYRRAIAIRKARNPGRGRRNKPVRSTF